MRPIDFRLRQLECFVTVAGTLNFSKAAKLLFMTQPTLSMQIKLLEEEFGSVLLERSRSHVRLTPSGEMFLGTARRILDEIEDVSTHIRSRQGESRLRLAADSGAMMYLIPALARRIKMLAPELKLVISESSPEEQLVQLLEGHVDALIGSPTMSHANVVFQQMGVDSIVAAVPSGHRLAGKSAISIRELADETILVTAPKDCRRHRPMLIELLQHFDVRANLVEISISCTSHLSMVAAEMGISLVPRAMETCTFPYVSFVPFVEQLPAFPVGVSYRRSSVSISLDVLTRALAEVMPHGLRANPGGKAAAVSGQTARKSL
jgi:DNA-binding transcriptional LysR family regulator